MYCTVVAVVVVVATTALLVQSILVHRPPSRQDLSQESRYQDTITTPINTSSDESRQSVTLISGRSAINAFAIYPIRSSLYCRSVPRQAGILQTATIT
jgi:anaerobic C4-dicarboxylate transporter